MPKLTMNFLGFGKKKPVAGDPPPDEDEDKKPDAEVEEEETEAEDDKKKPDAEVEDDDGDEDEQEETKAEKQARARERTRIGAIVTAGGPERLTSALSVALNTALPTRQAVAMVKALPADASGASGKTPLDRAMQGRSPSIAPSGATRTKPRSLADGMRAMVAQRGLDKQEA